MKDPESERNEVTEQFKNAFNKLDKAINSSPKYSISIWISAMASQIASYYMINDYPYTQYKLDMLKIMDYYEKIWKTKE